MATSTGIIRAEVIQRMKGAIAAGKSASKFLSEMKVAGLGYRRTTFLADYRSVGNVKAKTGLLKYVRKDYQPSPRLYAEVNWNLSREYMYKIRVESRLEPGKPIESRFVNIVSDRAMTPGELESEIHKTIWAVSGPPGAKIEHVIAETALKKSYE